MCIPLIARVIEVADGMAEVELVGGKPARANVALHPDVAAGQYVLLDRGLVLEVIDAEQAESILAFYSDLEDMWAKEEARSG